MAGARKVGRYGVWAVYMVYSLFLVIQFSTWGKLLFFCGRGNGSVNLLSEIINIFTE